MRRGEDALLDTALLGIAQLRAGLSTLLGQQLVLMGTFFVIPVYLQVVLGLDAFETGKRLLPLSVAMLVFALLGSADRGAALAARRSRRSGCVAVSIGALVMLAHARRRRSTTPASRSRWRSSAPVPGCSRRSSGT